MAHEIAKGRAMIAALLVLVFVLIVSASSLWLSILDTSGRIQPLSIQACTPDDWAADRECDTNGVDLGADDVLELTEDLRITVAGRVCVDKPDIGYNVTVEWVAVESDFAVPVVDVPITWTSPCEPEYEIDWAPPPQLLSFADSAGPGESLGRWRIVGRAEPVDPDRVAPYQWDSVRTFELIAPRQ